MIKTLILIALLALPAFPQVFAEMTGRVMDAEGNGVYHTRVQVIAPPGLCVFPWPGDTVWTNMNGNYVMLVETDCTFVIVASHKGYLFEARVQTPISPLSGVDFMAEN